MEKVGLVLEGGGMRGLYTAGVLDLLLDKEIYIPYIIGVSAGACQAFSYISKQKGRNFKVNTQFINDKRYLSIGNFIRNGSIFGMEFMFDDIPNKLLPFDFDVFNSTGQIMVVGTTNCLTGNPEYFTNKQGHDMFKVCQASSSLPMLAKDVIINDTPHLDGGVSDPIPIRKSIADGNRKNIVVLTRNKEYRKKMSKKSLWLMKKKYPKYNGLVKAYEKRHEVYNETLEYINRLEEEGLAIVIRPLDPVTVNRTEKNLEKLTDLYFEGYKEAGMKYEQMKEFLSAGI